MNRCQWLPLEGFGNANGNIPKGGPLGKFAALLPVLPFALLENVSKEKKDNRIRKYTCVRVRFYCQIGNGNRQQGGSL